MSNDNGGPAFPVPHYRDCEGMTLRDYFAAKAMQALLNAASSIGNKQVAPFIAPAAYEMADAMLAARKVKNV